MEANDQSAEKLARFLTIFAPERRQGVLRLRTMGEVEALARNGSAAHA